MENPARELYLSLSDGEQKLVIEALAVFDHPVPVSAIQHVLPALSVDRIMPSLKRCHAVGFEQCGSTYSLHPTDQRYVYDNLKPEGPGLSRPNLHRAVASWYATQRKEPADWKDYADVEPQVQQLQHLIRAGDFDKACERLNEIDREYLAVWGYYPLLIQLRQKLEGKLSSPRLRSENQGNLGCSFLETGKLDEARESYQEALEVAQAAGLKDLECRWTGNIGIAASDPEEGRRLLQRGQELATIGLRCIGWRICSSSIGFWEKARQRFTAFARP